MALKEEDYKEPACIFCTGFYNPEEKSFVPVPVERVMEKVDACYEVNDLDGALRILNFWVEESIAGGDIRGRISLFNELMGVYRKLGMHDRAKQSALEAVTLLEKAHLCDSITAGNVYLNCATVIKAAGDASGAVPYYDKAEQLYKKYLPENAKEFAGLYNNSATAYAELGQVDRAETLYSKAIQIMLSYQDGRLDAAISYANLAHLYENDEEKASLYLEKVREILDAEDIKKDGYFAFVCEKCAPSFDYFGYFLDALKYRELSKELYERNRTV